MSNTTTTSPQMVTLTHEQVAFLTTLLEDKIINAPVRQSSARVTFAETIKTVMHTSTPIVLDVVRVYGNGFAQTCYEFDNGQTIRFGYGDTIATISNH